MIKLPSDLKIRNSKSSDHPIEFQIGQGNAEVDGIQVTLDYNKPNDPKVLFEKHL